MIYFHTLFAFLVLFSNRVFAAGPYCPSAPANCNFKNVEEGLKDLKEDRFFNLLKSPDSVCKGHLMQGIKPEAVMSELIADPRFTPYVTPQISQCWKEGGSNSAKLETLSRYAYIQKRFDDNADNLLDYQVFADAVLGNDPLASIDCKKEAPELVGLVGKCQELKANCKKSDMAQTLAQSFMDDYKSQDIKSIESRFKDAKKVWEECSPRLKSGKTCQDAKKEMGQTAFRLQVFYANYPWAQEDKFLDQVGKRGFEDVNLVTKALKTQVAENSRNVATQLKDLTTASKCLLRNNCDSDKVNDVLERTKPLADQYFLKKGASKESNQSRAAVTQFVSYNNCLDDLGESQRKTSKTLWSSGIGAVGAVVTMGGSLVVTGLTAGGRVVMGAATVGSRAASVGKNALMLGQAVDGTVAVQSVYEASGHCGSKSTGYFKPAEKAAGPQACGIPTAGQMNFKKEYDGCVIDAILGAAGGASFLVGLKNMSKARQLAEAEQASGAARVVQPITPPPKTVNPVSAGANATAQAADDVEKVAVATTVADKAEKAATKVTAGENAAKGSAPIESISPATSADKATPSKLVSDGDYISIQTADNKKQSAMILQTQESTTGTLYQIATKSADGKVTKKWIGQKELESLKPRLSETSRTSFGSANMNKDLAQSAIQNISRGSPPEKVRAVVGKLNDTYDGGEARLKIASKLMGRELNDAEKKWIMAAHNTHADTAYGDIGSAKVRDKIKAGEGRPSTIDNKQTRLLMENGITGSEAGSNVSRRAPVPNSRLNETDRYTLVNGEKSLDVHITQSVVQNGVIYHKVEVPGYPGQYRSMTEDQLLAMIKPRTESAAARVESSVAKVDDVPTPAVQAPPVQASTATPRPEPRPLNPSAANDIEALNKAQMKTVVNTDRVEKLNGNSVTKPARMRERIGTDLGITDANRRAAIAYSPVADAKTMTNAVQKALGADSKVDVKQLRQTMSFNPASGYVSPNEFANAAKFVEEINAKGGVKALDKLPLSASEREALNAVMARAPAYASYVDPKVRPLGQLKIRKSPVEATNPNRDVVIQDAQGQTVQGRETIRQLGPDGENLSTVRYTKPDGTETTITVRTTETMDVAEAQRLQNFDRGITERANANRAARITASEQPAYINPHGVPRSEIAPSREVKVKVRTLDGVKDVEAVVQGAPYRGINGTQEVQVRFQDGVQNGKPVIRYESVAIDEIEKIKPTVVTTPVKADPVVYKPINETIRKPAEKALDPTSYDGQAFRRTADSEGADILLDRRIGEAAHVEGLKQGVKDDYLLLRDASVADRQAMFVSQTGRTSDARFNPRVFYAHQSREYHAAVSAPKGSPAAAGREQAELAYKGRMVYDAAGNVTRSNSARDVALRTARERGLPPEEIAKLEKWIDAYDQAAPRVRAVERAEAAQKEFEAVKQTLQRALKNESSTQPIAQSTFEKMAQSLNDLQLNPEQKRAAEIALKKIRCARPEWKIRDNQFSTFNLKCD